MTKLSLNAIKAQKSELINLKKIIGGNNQYHKKKKSRGISMPTGETSN